MPPKNGELTAAQVDRFVAVQGRVRSELGNRWTEIEVKSAEIRKKTEGNQSLSFADVRTIFSDVANIYIEARRAQVGALNIHKFSDGEYTWVKHRVYEAAGMEVASGTRLFGDRKPGARGRAAVVHHAAGYADAGGAAGQHRAGQAARRAAEGVDSHGGAGTLVGAIYNCPMSRLEQIWIKRMHRGPMDPAQKASVVAGKGIVGNANQGGRRQVTIVSSRHWEEVTAPLGHTPDPRLRRANLLVSDVDFTQSARTDPEDRSDPRSHLRRDASLRANGEAAPGLQAAMTVPFGGGAFGEVLDDGEIAIGDSVDFEPSTSCTSGTRGTLGTLISC